MIQDIEINLHYRATVGEFATLGIDGNSSIFSFGIVDKAEVVGKSQIVKIVNNGGLTAKNLLLKMNNGVRVIDQDGNEDTTEISNGFFVKSHNCPRQIPPGDGCEVEVSYANSNLLLDDPSLIYDGTLKIEYDRDNDESRGSLIANFGFTSSAIEARFIFSGVTENLSFSQIVTGTKSEPKIIELQNDGFKEGVLKSFKFYDTANRLIAKCDKVNPETDELECQKISGSVAELSELPFKIYDRNSEYCVGRSLSAKKINVAGEKMFFSAYLLPSTKFQELQSGIVNKVTLVAEYDTRLENQETIKVNFLSDISYSFKKPALVKGHFSQEKW